MQVAVKTENGKPGKTGTGLIRSILHGAVPGLLFAAIVLARMVMTGPVRIAQGELTDPDSFMQLDRFREVLATGGWHGGLFMRDNAPFGMVLHWTKAFDILYLTLASPIAIVSGWDRALHITAVIIGPLSIAVLVMAAVAAVLPICDRGERQIVGLTVALASLVLKYGQIGNTDHHVWIAACWVASLGLLFRLMLGRNKNVAGLLAGLMAAVTLWLTVECILALALAITVLGLVWIRDGRPLRAGNLQFTFGFSGCLIALLVFDPPYGGFLSPDLDRLSIVYITFAILLTLLWIMLAAMPQAADRWRIRLVAAASGAVLCTAVLVSLFSGILNPEQTVFAEGSVVDWNAAVGEMLPAYGDGQTAILTLPIPMIALIFALCMAWRHRRSPAGQAWLAFTLILVPTLAFGLRHVRFMIYPEILAALAIAKMMTHIRPWIGKVAPTLGHILEPLIALAIVFALPTLAARAAEDIGRSASLETQQHAGTSKAGSNCRVQPIAAALDDVTFMNGGDQILMTTMNIAPEVLYWSRNRVVAGPYHRNVDGIRDEFNFFTGKDDNEAQAILARRGISFILICPSELQLSFPDPKDGRMLATRLVQGPVPDWLKERHWPAGTASDLRLFQVTPEAQAQP